MLQQTTFWKVFFGSPESVDNLWRTNTSNFPSKGFSEQILETSERGTNGKMLKIDYLCPPDSNFTQCLSFENIRHWFVQNECHSIFCIHLAINVTRIHPPHLLFKLRSLFLEGLDTIISLKASQRVICVILKDRTQ